MTLSAVVALVTLVAVACGTGEPEGGEDGESTELTVWFAREYCVPPQDDLERFEADNDVALTVDVQPDDDLFQQLIRMQDAGQELPDVVHLDGFLRPVVAEAGVVVPIQDVVDQWAEEDPDSFEQIYDAVWEEGMYDGELYGMASAASMEEVYYRADWLTEAGGAPPETWDDVLDTARTIQAAQPDATPLGWWATRGSGANHVFASMRAMGVGFEGSAPDLQSEAGLYWIAFVQTLGREGLVHPEAIAWSDDEMRGGFVGGVVGMMLDSMPTAFDAEEGGLVAGEDFDLVPMPLTRDGGVTDGEIVAPARNFHITSSGEENKEVAGRFLRFLMESDVAKAVMLEGCDPHRSAGVLEDADFMAAELPHWGEENVHAFSEAGIFPVGPNFPAAEDLMERLNQHVVANPDEDPATVAEQWQEEFDAIE